MESIFFIAGCQRTGTTLMRLILECHSQIFCHDELTSYDALASSDLSSPPGKGTIGFKVPRWTETLDGPVLFDHGQNVRTLNRYSGAKIIFMLRDVRDTVLSMINLKTGESSWLRTWGRPILESHIEHDPEFRRRFNREIAAWNNFGRSDAATGALYWKFKTQSYFRFRAKGLKVLGIQYEDLVTQPKPALQSICRFLEVPWESALLDHPRFRHAEVFDSGLTIGNTDPTRSISDRSVGQWKHALSREDVNQIQEISTDIYRASALDDVLGAALEWEQQEGKKTVEAALEG